MKKLLLILIILFLSIGIFVIGYLKNLPQFAKPVGIVITAKNDRLQSNINTFMESQKTGNELGADNYHCANHIYGYDKQYAYAMVYCSGLVTKSNGKMEQGSAFSIPTRLEYKLPDFQIVSFKQQGDDNSNPSLQQLFPKQLYDLAIKQTALPELQQFDKEIKSKIKK